MMRKSAIQLVAVQSLLLAACGGKSDANESNFAAALNQYFAKQGELCLNIKVWPVDVNDDEHIPTLFRATDLRTQMEALQRVGLVSAQSVEVVRKNLWENPSGAKVKAMRYSLTAAARPYLRESDVESFGMNGLATVHQADICWGKKAVDRIVKWVGPMKYGDYQEAGITYTYKIKHTASWVNNSAIQAAFPDVKRILTGAGESEETHSVKLTSIGWEANGLDFAH